MVLGCISVLILGACSDNRNPDASGIITPNLAVGEPDPTPAGPSLDQIFLDMSRSIPGFAGLFVDVDGTPTIQLVDTLRGDAARAAVQERFSEVASVRNGVLRVHRVAHSFDELDAWRTKLYSTGVPTGVNMVDLDERNNVLRLGVTRSEDVAAVQKAALAAGIPADGLQVGVVPELRQTRRTQWLASQVRPTMGGLNVVGSGLGQTCTLGFNAKKTSATRYLVANSHCTANFGVVNGDVFGQPLNGYPLGAEITDPAFSAVGGCPQSYLCRFSDAALVQYDTTSVGSNYTAAHTTFEYTGSDTTQSGSTELGIEPFSLVGEMSSASLVSGTALSKVGASSGWTSGTIGTTCADMVRTSNTMLLCQYGVSAIARAGDSGSPVFSYELSTGKAWLAGILWARSLEGFTFSPLSGVKTDLGAMTVSKPVF
jgi:hypothetical protein